MMRRFLLFLVLMLGVAITACGTSDGGEIVRTAPTEVPVVEEDPTEAQKNYLKSLRFSGDYLLNFINDILDVNKIEAQKIEL
ncbi:MAG: hypothetical protein ACPG8W_24045, partial [Candidatus Promineifilaceae bacterium]